VSFDEHGLIARALAAGENAYTPFSGFCVGAAILTAAGNVYAGCNVENSSYGLTLCAERNAVAAAVAAEGPAMQLVAVVCAADSDSPVWPCGACRQVLLEFARPETLVIAAMGVGRTERELLTDLLPRPFRLRTPGADGAR
jgi:cytidine deaminase